MTTTGKPASHERTSPSRWAAIGAAIAVSLGAGGYHVGHAALGSGERTSFVPITPCRLIDTRPAPDNRGPRTTPLGPDEVFTVSAWGSVGDCAITDQATGLVLNVTAVGQSNLTYLTIYPTGAVRPEASSLNPSPGQPPTPNAVTVNLNGSGQFDIYNLAGSLHVIVDVVGYYEDHHHDDRYFTEAEIDALLDARAPRTGKLVLGPKHFRSDSSTVEYTQSGVAGGTAPAGGAHLMTSIAQPSGYLPAMVAPVNLPAGTRITRLTVVYHDSGPGQFGTSFGAEPSGSTGSPGALFGAIFGADSPAGQWSTQTITLTGFQGLSESFSYYVQVYSSAWLTNTGTMRIRSVTLEYQLP